MSHTNDNIMFHRFGWYTRLIIRKREKERAKTKREGYFKWMKLRMFLENTFLAIMSNEETKVIKIMMMMIFECLFGWLFLFLSVCSLIYGDKEDLRPSLAAQN